MASITLAASSNTVVSTGWTNPTNAYGTATDGVFATASPAKNGTVSTDYGFASFGLPAGSVISSVVITVAWKLSATTLATLGVQGRNNGVADSAAEVTDTTDTAVTQKTFTFGTLPSVSDLNTAGLVVARVRDSRGNTNTAHTGSLDFVSMTVVYTPIDLFTPTLAGQGSLTAVVTEYQFVAPTIFGHGWVAGTNTLYPSTGLVPGSPVLPSFGTPGIFTTHSGGVIDHFTPTLAGQGSLTATFVELHEFPVTLAGQGSLSETIVELHLFTVSLAGQGSLSAAINEYMRLSPTLAGVGSLSASITEYMLLTPTLAGQGALSESLVRKAAIFPSLTGHGSLSAAVANYVAIAPTLAGIGTLTPNIIEYLEFIASLSGAASVSPTLVVKRVIPVSLGGQGSMFSTVAGGVIIEPIDEIHLWITHSLRPS